MTDTAGRSRPAPPVLAQSVLDLLAAPNPAVMATIRRDGSPVTVATWYLWHDGSIVLNLDAGRVRLKHLRADPRVALTVLDGEGWGRHVSLQGRVVTLEDDPDLTWIDRIARHYTGRPYPNRKRPRVTAWMEIERVHVWGFPTDQG